MEKNDKDMADGSLRIGKNGKYLLKGEARTESKIGQMALWTLEGIKNYMLKQEARTYENPKINYVRTTI